AHKLNYATRCLQELRDSPRQKSLAQTLQLLQRCVPLLHTAKHSDLKHSRDQQVSLSKDYAFQLTERTIRALTSLLVDDADSKELQDRNGIFSQRVSRLLALLSCPDSMHLSKSEFSTHVETVVFYCMLLADSSSPDAKLDLVKHCWALLQLSKSICSHVSQQEGQPGQSWGESSLEEECHTMRKEGSCAKPASYFSCRLESFLSILQERWLHKDLFSPSLPKCFSVLF
uniref:Uncharacterized protein n=1 Tax=Dromaius novaehollandiae TaxID=8790 RepID=A0A8C4IY00_DRONO